MAFTRAFRAVAFLLFSLPAVAAAQFSMIQELPGQSDDDFGYNGHTTVEAPNGDVLAFVVKNGEPTGPCCPPPGEPANLLIYRTSDGGATWADPVVFDTAIEDGLQGISLPAVAVANGAIFLTYGYINDFAPNFSFSNKVFMSMDSGATWSRLNDKDSQSYHLVATASGAVFSLDAEQTDTGGERLVAARYESGSDSWTRLGPVPYDAFNACGRYLHATDESNLTFYSSECFFGYGGTVDAFRSVSTDGGQTWGDNELAFTSDSGFGDWGSVVTMPGGGVRAVVSNGTFIAYRDSADDGATWSDPTNWTAGTENNGDISPYCSPSSLGALCVFLGRRGSENQLVHIGVAGESRDPLLGPAPIGPAHSGSWWNSDQNGHGFALEAGEVAGSPVVVAYWYIYNSVGDPIFFVGSGVPEGNVVDINFVSPVGMRFGEFNPLVNDEMDSGGVARFVFDDDSNGTFSYEPSPFSVNEWGHTAIENLPVTKLFSIPDTPREFPSQD